MRLLLIVISLATLPGLAFAQGNRANTWEGSFAAIYQDSAGSGAEGGSNLKLDSELGLGINFGYNFTNKLYLGGDFEWLRPDFSATLIEDVHATTPALLAEQWRLREAPREGSGEEPASRPSRN